MPSAFNTYRHLLSAYLRPQGRRVLLMAVLVLSSIGLQLLNPQILRYFIDSATAGASLAPLLLAAALFILLALANQAIAVWATYVSENVAWTATNQLRTDLLAHALTLDLAFHKEHTSGELIERIDGDVDTLSNFFSQFVIYLLGNLLLIIGVLALLFREDWRVGLAISLFALLAIVVLVRIRDYAVPHWEAIRQMSADFFGFLGEQLIGTEDTRANGATSYVMWRFYQLIRRWLPAEYKATLASYTMGITTLVIFALGNALALALGGYLWTIGVFSIATVYLVFYYTNLLTDPIEKIRTQFQDLQKAAASIQRVQRLLATKPEIADPLSDSLTLPSGPLSVELRSVTFGYLPAEPILHDLSLKLRPGEVLGLLGRTGSGKTTLARLLPRLYDVQSGEVCLADIPVRSLALRDLRRHIGMVTQDVQLFHATVRANLALFDPSISDERIMEALEDLGLADWCRALPLGLDTELGSDGEGLSAGEAQLLAFTRVFLADPGLVILDEASSRLDLATEQLIERAISKLLKGRTGIIIAHRLATVQRADAIMVLDSGRALESGARQTLAADPTSHFHQLLLTGLEEVLV